MWLVLYMPKDLSALWAYEGLKARGLQPLQLISVQELMNDVRWEHRISTSATSTLFQLANGQTFNSDHIAGVLNRLTWLPTDYLYRTKPSDQEYAAQENLAFFVSWLYGLHHPVLNQATPYGLSGRLFSIAETAFLAAQANLPVASYRQCHKDTTWQSVDKSLNEVSTTVIVLGNQVIGDDLPIDIKEGCLRLANAVGMSLLGIDFARLADGGWTLVGITPVPDLRPGGNFLLDLLTNELKKEV